MTTNVDNLKLWSLYLKNDSIGLLLGLLRQASSEVWIRYKFRKPLNVRYVVTVTCTFTFDWDLEVFCICL